MNAPLPNRYRIKSPDGTLCALAELSADHSHWTVRVYRHHYGFPGPIDRFTVEAFPSGFRVDRGLLGVSRETRLRHGITGTWHPIDTEEHARRKARNNQRAAERRRRKKQQKQQTAKER